MRYPKFEEKVKQHVVEPAQRQGTQGTYGIIVQYDTQKNAATVLLAHPGSDDMGETIYGVPCPLHRGLQTVAPVPGTPCWIAFKDASTRFPIITNYFNHIFDQADYDNNYVATNNVPKFMYSM